MEIGKPSQTAVSAALFRASHLQLYDGPKIHEDTFALTLSGLGGPEKLAEFSALVEATGFPLRRASAFFAFRHRFSEERMHAALARGVEQLVLLGAGLDSFALRHPELPTKVRFVEIDHPASQRAKIQRCAELGLSTPGVHYVAVDFSSQSLADGLAAAGVDRRKPVFIAWLGVTQYIPAEATYETLSFVARLATRSEIVFDVILPVDEQPADEREMSRIASEHAAARGEPWVAYFAPEELEGRLKSLGFSRVTRLTPARADAYYDGQPPNARPLGAWQMLAAIV
jgi:methyltransferase (TIGR00027 family)